MQNKMNLDLKNKKWKEFLIGDIFNIKTGALLPKKVLKKGNIARITATDSNNGVFDYYASTSHKNFRVISNFISVSFLGSVFYHPYKASLDMKIHSVQLKEIEFNKYLAHFIVLALKRTTELFSYGDQLSSSDLPKKKILLPINKKSEPDFEFMEAFMKQKEQEKFQEYDNYIDKRIKALKDFKTVEPIEEKEFLEFEIEKLFEVKSGKRLTKADMKKGKKPFIGATDSNNGITAFVSNTNTSEDSNVLGVNYNGSVVENFYHPYKAIFSDDVKRLSFRETENNKHLFLFVKNQILKQKAKYQYGYKFNGTRMNRQKIMLPVNDQNEPDYDYMENYMKQLEYKKLNEYLRKKEKLNANA
jgi:hypothetical protein